MAPRTLMPSPDLMDPNASQSGQGTHSRDSNVAYTNEPTQLADAIHLMQSAISQTGQGTPSMVSNMAYTGQPTRLSAPTISMAALAAPANTHSTHFVTPPRTLMPFPRFMDPTTHQTGQNTHFRASNRAYNSQPTQLADAITLMQSAISQTGQGTPPMAPSMAYTGQPTQRTAPGTPTESNTSQADQDAHIVVSNTPVRPSTMPGGNPWPSPSSSTNSPNRNTISIQSGINEGALGQQMRDCVPPEGPQGYMSDDNIWNEEFRVGGPQLCALPATTTLFAEGSHHYSLVWDGDLLNRVYRMAHRFNIEPLEAMLVTRQSEWGLMPAPIVTVLIFANRKNMDDSWVQCAQLVRKYLTTQIMEPNISVEIADPRAFPWKGPDLALPMSPH
ncbi:uncharacterized protein N7503_002909 [Penicillium pulvis]|uniref:uncharacterized protein n=1 Tax=Penicillium pulvis TaxID=1562058 RepID=UPI0025492555|nr:uncharacterized protein N7503_002909 [Penicillium pulvis]KAJ5810691.1 hypothetical protein N7503_002909 [Penicillium pulvis]